MTALDEVNAVLNRMKDQIAQNRHFTEGPPIRLRTEAEWGAEALLDFVDLAREGKPEMEYAEAVEQVLAEYPELYEQYRTAKTPRGLR